jgi:hypothetical protein
MHKRLLSNAAPEMIAFAARVGQQVSSTKTGRIARAGADGALAGLHRGLHDHRSAGDEQQARVSCLQSALKESSVGFSMMHTMFSMPVSR